MFRGFKNQPGFAEIAVSATMLIGLLASVVLIGLNSARAKSRDAKRLADIRQMSSALELYRFDRDQYPDKFSELSPAYIGISPTAPTPADGDCTAEQNTYAYIKIAKKAYQISFCLGASTGGYSAGEHKLTETGIK